MPRFITDRIGTLKLYARVGTRARKLRSQYGLTVLRAILRQEYQARDELLRSAISCRKDMGTYDKCDYLYTKRLRENLIAHEHTVCRERLEKKLRCLKVEQLEQLVDAGFENCERLETGEQKERVTCLDAELTSSETSMLSKGPKFVVARGQVEAEEIRMIESEIEAAACGLRRRFAETSSEQQKDRDKSDQNPVSDTQNDEVRPILQQVKVRKLARTNPSVTQPERLDAVTEGQICIVKDKVLSVYRRYRQTEVNITREESQALRELKKKAVVIKCSDKSKSMVVTSTEEYCKKAATILDDSSNYERTDMTAQKLEERVANHLKGISNLKKNLPGAIYSGLFPCDTKLPEFYGLPKIHKPGAPLRPVVAAFDGPLSALSILLERILHQLLKFVPAHIWNTEDAMKSLRVAFPDLAVPEGTIIFSMDVVGLYPSIPVADGIEAVMEKLDECQDRIDTLGLTARDIKRMLELVLQNNYFRFGEVVYRQKTGVAMGNHLAPPLAIVFMDRLEHRMLQTAEIKPEFYNRYVDDILSGWTHGEEDLVKFIEHCNSQHPNIRFTWEKTCDNNPISFMDTSISINNGCIEYELYQKPSDSGVNLNYTSAIPFSQKMAVATSQFRRAIARSSTEEGQERSCRKIAHLLRCNEFPPEAIAKAARAANRPAKKKAERTQQSLYLPFRSDSLKKQVDSIIKKSRLPLRVVYRNGPTVKNHLIRSALKQPGCAVREKYARYKNLERKPRGRPPDDCISCQAGLAPGSCARRGVVYSMRCNLCGEEYVGETMQTVRQRFGEHHFQARNRKEETPWGEHMRKKHPGVTLDKAPVFGNCRIIADAPQATTRKIREAVEIRDRKPAVNRVGGWRIAKTT